MTAETSQPTSDRNRSEQLQRRLARYAARVLELCEDLPDTKVGRHLRDQLLRSATAPGAHYAEARNAESRDDFTHKIALAAKEMRESQYWLLVAASLQDSDDDLERWLEESSELVAILFRSFQTARQNRDS